MKARPEDRLIAVYDAEGSLHVRDRSTTWINAFANVYAPSSDRIHVLTSGMPSKLGWTRVGASLMGAVKRVRAQAS